MTKKSEVQEAILEVCRELPSDPGYPPRAYFFSVEEIIQKVRELRGMKALKELVDEGKVEWDEEAQGWRLARERAVEGADDETNIER